MKEIYRPVLERKFKCPMHAPACPDTPSPAWLVTTINSAELIKHASNSFLAVKISYANMVADLAEKLGADIGRSGARGGDGPAHRDELFPSGPGIRRILLAERFAGVRASGGTLRRGFFAC